VHDTINPKNAKVQVKLVFGCGLARDLNDEIELVGRVGAEGDFVPGVEAHGSLGLREGIADVEEGSGLFRL
jgi:hypothetical protein